jgi:hypothetical protein
MSKYGNDSIDKLFLLLENKIRSIIGSGYKIDINGYFVSLEPDVYLRNERDVFKLLNSDRRFYVMESPMHIQMTVLVEREFAQKVLTLGVFP